MTAHHARRAISAGRLAVASVVMGLGTWMATATSAQAPQPRASVDTQAAQYQSGSTSIDVYLARPRGATRRPAVIVLHDDLGANSRFRELAQQFAEAGFVALAPHLPSRAKVAASEPGEGRPQRHRDRRPLRRRRLRPISGQRSRFFSRMQASSQSGFRPLAWAGVNTASGRSLKARRPFTVRLSSTASSRPTTTVCEPSRRRCSDITRSSTTSLRPGCSKRSSSWDQEFTYYIYPTVPGFFWRRHRTDSAGDRGLGDLAAAAGRNAPRPQPRRSSPGRERWSS